jgi:hypothetical protein
MICLLNFSTVPTMWYVFQLFRQCGMFFNCSDSVVCFSTVPTVWYVFQLFRHCGMFFNCSDSVVCFSTVPTVWYVAFHFIQYPLYLLIQKCLMKIDAHVQACERFGQLFYSIFKYFIQEQYCL